MEDVGEEGAVEVSEEELLPKDFCGIFNREGEREAVLEFCGNEGGETGGADSLAEKNAWRLGDCFVETMTFCNETL